jgi:hypothetical protein
VIDVPKEKGSVFVRVELVRSTVAPASPIEHVMSRPPVVGAPTHTTAARISRFQRDDPGGLSGWRVVGVGVVGVGLAGIALGTSMGIKAWSDYGASNDPNIGKCDPHGAACASPKGVDLRTSANSAGLVSTISFIAGGALLATGVTLVVLAPRRAPHRVEVTAGPASLALDGTF